MKKIPVIDTTSQDGSYLNRLLLKKIMKFIGLLEGAVDYCNFLDSK